MPSLRFVAVVLVAATTPCLAQDFYEPNPSLARLTADDAFAAASRRSLKTAGIVAPAAVKTDSAGRVVVAGTSRAPDGTGSGPRVARLLSDGRLDTTFGDAGVAAPPLGPAAQSSLPAFSLELDPQGRIVVAGVFVDQAPPNRANPSVVRLSADGSLDASFAQGGVLAIDALATGFASVGPVRAVGVDGAMILAAQKVPTGRYTPDLVAGFLRITADGSIDATYGGGFASLGFVTLRDFAVDDSGRVVASSGEALGLVHYGDPAVGMLRFAADGTLDPTFPKEPTAQQVAIDGQGRIVAYSGTFQRRLDDGSLDASFSGDGRTELLPTGYPANLRGEEELLAVARGADRYVLVSGLQVGGKWNHGIGVRSFDPTRTGAIASWWESTSRGKWETAAALAVADDATAAFVAGLDPEPVVLRVELTGGRPRPLPNLRVKFLGWPHVVDLGAGRYSISARIRITNAGRGDADRTFVDVGFDDDGPPSMPLVPDPRGVYEYGLAISVPAKTSTVRTFTREVTSPTVDLAGLRLTAFASSELPELKLADNSAKSQAIEPLFAPR